MRPTRRQILGWGILASAALLGGAWLLQLDRAARISTDVLDLIPAGEQAPELMLVRQLASQAEARTMLFVLTDENGHVAAPSVATRFAEELRQEASFAEALALGDGDAAARDALGAELFQQRLTLLFPSWLRERETEFRASGRAPAEFVDWLAQAGASRLADFLPQPEALAFQEIIPADPLLLLPDAVARLKGGLSLVQPAETTASAALVWAKLTASPLSEAGQAPAFAAIDRATAATRAEFPGLAVHDTGINRFAAASRARIQSEVTALNALSLVAVLTVAFSFIRRVHRGLHLLPVVLLAMLGAWTCTTFVFERVHILVFVVGSLLAGVAIDYGFYLYMQPAATPAEDYWAKVRRLAKPLLASCFTTVAGFALLLFSELPLIRQLGVFVGSGLLCALAAAVLYFSTVRDPFLETRTFRGGRAVPARARRWVRHGLALVWLAALPGLAWLTWRDDIRELEIPSPELKREDARIRAQFGDGGNRTAYLSYGGNFTEARDSLARFEQWLQSTGEGNARMVGLASVIPSAETHARAVEFVRTSGSAFLQRLGEALEEAGFEAAEFEPFWSSFAAHAVAASAADLPRAASALQKKLPGPLGLLLHSGESLTWFVTLAGDAPATPPPPETRTVSANQLQSLNEVFARYRQTALWFSLGGLGIVGLGVFLAYGIRDGWRIFAIPCGTCLGVFGLFGWLGISLNLFHLLGAFLGVCLLHNYSIFSAASAYRDEPPPPSVRLSGLTTAASFGVLALSSIPVVRALGLTVSLMVLGALLIIEFEHLSDLGKKDA